MASGSICWIQFKLCSGGKIMNFLPDFFGDTIVVNCCTDLNQLSATSVLAEKGILLFWVPAWEAETLHCFEVCIFEQVPSFFIVDSCGQDVLEITVQTPIQNQGNRASSVSNLSWYLAQVSHLKQDIHTNDIYTRRQEKAHPSRHSDTIILKPTSSFLSVPCLFYCTFFHLGNKRVDILKTTSSFSIASCSAVICNM